MLFRSSSHGISRLDTAISYPGVYSILSQALFAISNKPNFRIATKFAFKGISQEIFLRQLQYSRDIFHSIEVDIVFVHDWNQLSREDFLVIEEIATVFPNLKIGASIYEPQELEEVLENMPSISVIQFPFNILNQSFLPYFRIMRERDIEMWARSLFLQGALDWRSTMNIFRDHPSIVKLQRLGELLNVSPIELALDFIKEFTFQSVIGVATSTQLKEILQALDLPKLNIQYESFASTDKRLVDPREWS